MPRATVDASFSVWLLGCAFGLDLAPARRSDVLALCRLPSYPRTRGDDKELDRLLLEQRELPSARGDDA
ncbi:hypothetical protein BEK98_43095 [Streptomyces diastatochromogenes]|uniref:Uncharacterized protein n=1 Tax=Streptomyces diastatochromogenes TaxID=42236 RepID=A0A233RWX7_STRDA|nr:hypothetical protein BEK98_43095 [Streptomyces diastatochromogenes]